MMDPPEYLSENISDHQNDVWDSMRDRDKFQWASDHDHITESESDTGDANIDSDDADSIRSMLDEGDPKALWAIADSSVGKDLLLGTDWYGVLDLGDTDTMERFNAYVGKAKAA